MEITEQLVNQKEENQKKSYKLEYTNKLANDSKIEILGG